MGEQQYFRVSKPLGQEEASPAGKTPGTGCRSLPGGGGVHAGACWEEVASTQEDRAGDTDQLKVLELNRATRASAQEGGLVPSARTQEEGLRPQR